ncbi:MAG: dTDP-4-dehydrorhamnose reductase [Candidatus Omnitrophica bacterium]|jgi:dTDP-4-dehydrorhamnose reductase|nr:dTDP-4-dehydrorhamnose reductase [Candidatus Omnitrophota bacterium]
MHKKILVTGSRGMLGATLLPLLKNYDTLGIDKGNCDITNKSSLAKTIGNLKFDVVVHCAAYTDVDGAEGKTGSAFLVNEEGTRNVIESINNKDCFFIYISTDYVFDGNKKTAYTEEDIVNPLSIYGKSKLAGENLVAGLNKYIIIRTSWLFGPNGKNFISTVLRLAKEKETIEVAGDQIGSPTYTLDLAKAISDIINIYFTKGITSGIYNITNTGFCSWAELARYIIKEAGFKTHVAEIKSKELKRAAQRPKNSMLSKEKFKGLSGYYLPTWQKAVQHYLKNYLLN